MKRLGIFYDCFHTPIECASIKRDPELRAKTVRFGVKSIVFSLFAAAMAIGGGFLWAHQDNLLVIFAIVIAIALFIGAVVMFIDALINTVCQLSLNKKAIGFISLVILMAAIAGAVIGILTIL